MRIGEITSSERYRMDEEFQNLLTFGAKFWFSKWKKIQKFSKFYNFDNHQISVIDELIK